MSETDIKRWCHILLNETAQGKNNTKCPPVAVSILHECYLHTCQYLPVIYIKKKPKQSTISVFTGFFNFNKLFNIERICSLSVLH